MRCLVLSLAIAFVLLLGVLALAQAQAPDEPVGEVAMTSGTALGYQVAVPDANQKRIVITGTLTGLDAPSLTLARPWAWLPALPPIEDLVIADGGGTPLAYSLSIEGDPGNDGHHRYTISDTRAVHTIRFSYVISMAAVGPDEYWHFEPDEYTIVESHLIFLQPLSTALTTLTMTFDLPSGWVPVSRLFARDGYYQAVVTDTVNYGNPEETYYLWGPIGLGQFDVYTDTAGGVEFVVAVPPDNAAMGPDIAASRFAANRYISQHLWPLGNGTTPLRYINFYPGYPMSSRDHCHGDFRAISDANELYERQRELTHVTFHEWFLHDRLDYPQWDVLHPEMWAEENLIDYFAVRVAQESGNWSAEQANAEWLSMYHAYTTTILGTPNDVPLTYSGTITGTAQYILWYKKGALVHHLFDYQVSQVTEGTKSIEDVFRFLHDHVTNTKSDRLDVDEFLLAYNLVTGRDFGSFFSAYITGTEPLPFVVVSGALQIDDAALPDTPQLDSLSLVRNVLQIGLVGSDTDGDGILDCVEAVIGTNPADSDSDHDGLDDREEFGVVVDGQAGEYGLDQPLIEDPQGDSQSPEAGTDIKEVYAKTFLNENGDKELYLVLSTWDNQYNPDAWYEIFLTTDSDFYQYRFESGRSSLWHEENGNMEDISNGRVESQFKDWLEAKIPLDLLGSPDQITVRAFTRAGGDPDAPDGVDSTSDGIFTNAPQIFITDPLNPDTDGDGVSDGVEVQFGSNPTDPASAPNVWPIYLPIVLRSH